MEEPSRIIKINLEYYKKSQVLSVFAISLVLFIICVIVAATISPDILDGDSLDYYPCSVSNLGFCFRSFSYDNNAYFSVKLSPHNQIFFLQLNFDSRAEINEELKYDLFILTSYNQFDNYKYKEENKTLTIKCSDGECDSELLFYIPYIEHDLYIVDLRLYGSIKVESMKFKIRYITQEFTDFFIGTKYFFFAISLLALVHFVFHLCTIKLKYWALESKLSGFMIFNLIIFNEPLLYYAMSEVTAGWTALSIYCNAQFSASMILFWYQMLHPDMSLTRKFITTIVEGSLVCAFITLVSVMYSLTIKEQKVNPTFSWESDLPGIAKGTYIAGLTILIILGLIMFAHIVLTLRNIKNYPLRKRLLLIFIYLMIFITFLFIGIGAFQPLPRSGTLLLTCVSYFNILLILLSWLYTPSRKAYKDFLNDKKLEENGGLQLQNDPHDLSFQGFNRAHSLPKPDELRQSIGLDNTIIQGNRA